MNVLDTNIWIYSHDSRDSVKQDKAQRLIGELRPLALPWQVGCEFIAASRKLASQGFDEDKAWKALAAMQSLADTILLPSLELWQESRSIQSRHSLSFWDALLIASCIRGKIRTPHTEDMGAPRVIDGLNLVNPFVSS
jgi:predicted nucleic acid-binding protein